MVATTSTLGKKGFNISWDIIIKFLIGLVIVLGVVFLIWYLMGGAIQSINILDWLKPKL